MTKEALFPAGLRKPGPPYSPVVASGDLVLLSGQGPFQLDGSIAGPGFAEEAHATFENLRLCLEAAGCGFDDVLRVGAYLADLGDFAEYNDLYRQYFREPFPARTTVQAGLLGIRIELDAIARRPA